MFSYSQLGIHLIAYKQPLVLRHNALRQLSERHRLDQVILLKTVQPGAVQNRLQPPFDPVHFFTHAFNPRIVIVLQQEVNDRNRGFHLMDPLLDKGRMVPLLGLIRMELLFEEPVLVLERLIHRLSERSIAMRQRQFLEVSNWRAQPLVYVPVGQIADH